MQKIPLPTRVCVPFTYCPNKNIPHKHACTRMASSCFFLSAFFLYAMADLVSKPGTKSIVWLYYGLKIGVNGEVSDEGTVLCCSCRKTVTAKHGNTSILPTHL